MESSEPNETTRPGRKPKVKKSENLWLLSFSDLSFVLLCFFVLLLSFSETSTRKFERITEGMKAHAREAELGGLKELSDKVEKAIRKRGLEQAAQVTYDAKGVAVEFKDVMLFARGSARPNPRFRRVADKVLDTIATAPTRYELVFEGHTDDTPMRGRRYDSNWDLSAARGISLLEEFRNKGVKRERMSVRAFADTRPKIPVEGRKGSKLEQARRANRRVVIRIR